MGIEMSQSGKMKAKTFLRQNGRFPVMEITCAKIVSRVGLCSAMKMNMLSSEENRTMIQPQGTFCAIRATQKPVTLPGSKLLTPSNIR